ncbi:MAG: hypothetical protein CMH54_04460 [Myxococcales bacterium]|nr:hypothetical protein [Myxococcales bacterium]|tara:strand:+ start:197 stop:748 length:552 start_codon:yes stop_codon:yes gene_type:complete
MTRFFPLGVLLFLACATPQNTNLVDRQGRLLDEEAERTAVGNDDPLPPDTARVRVKADHTGINAEVGRRVLTRSEVQAIQRSGPGKLLQYVKVAPAFWSSRFLGFRLEKIRSKDARTHPPNLMQGDVILRINKVRIKTPDDFFSAFQTLDKAQKIVFDIWRNEKRILVSYDIIDGEPKQTGSR